MQNLNESNLVFDKICLVFRAGVVNGKIIEEANEPCCKSNRAYATRTRVREVVVAQLVARLLPTLEILEVRIQTGA